MRHFFELLQEHSEKKKLHACLEGKLDLQKNLTSKVTFSVTHQSSQSMTIPRNIGNLFSGVEIKELIEHWNKTKYELATFHSRIHAIDPHIPCQSFTFSTNSLNFALMAS